MDCMALQRKKGYLAPSISNILRIVGLKWKSKHMRMVTNWQLSKGYSGFLTCLVVVKLWVTHLPLMLHFLIKQKYIKVTTATSSTWAGSILCECMHECVHECVNLLVCLSIKYSFFAPGACRGLCRYEYFTCHGSV